MYDNRQLIFRRKEKKTHKTKIEIIFMVVVQPQHPSNILYGDFYKIIGQTKRRHTYKVQWQQDSNQNCIAFQLIKQ